MYQRKELYHVIERMAEPRRFIQAILGPRQVGKTTLVRQFTENSEMPTLLVSADSAPASDRSWIGSQWEAARFASRSAGMQNAVLIIDEIQKIDNWSEQVKLEWDKDTASGIGLKVILLGSSRLMLQQGLSESLAGRFETIHMTHWSFAEMHAAFGITLDQFIWFGGYPGAAGLIGDETRWRDYIQNSLIETTLSKDILMLARIEKPALLRSLFELGCHYSGQLLSFNKMLGQLQDAGNTTTLSHYLTLLDGAGLLAGLNKHSGHAIVQRASIPKWQVYNTALYSVYQPLPFQQARARPEIWGRHVEVAAGAHLLNECVRTVARLKYWRERNEEVDFILDYRGEIAAIEIKSGAKASRTGLDAFSRNFRPKKMYIAGTSGIPMEAFLKSRIEDLF